MTPLQLATAKLLGKLRISKIPESTIEEVLQMCKDYNNPNPNEGKKGSSIFDFFVRLMNTIGNYPLWEITEDQSKTKISEFREFILINEEEKLHKIYTFNEVDKSVSFKIVNELPSTNH
jgi:hypothetical protein